MGGQTVLTKLIAAFRILLRHLKMDFYDVNGCTFLEMGLTTKYGQKIFLVSKESRPPLKLPNPHIQRLPGTLSSTTSWA
jgi:hypothetical protein